MGLIRTYFAVLDESQGGGTPDLRSEGELHQPEPELLFGPIGVESTTSSSNQSEKDKNDAAGKVCGNVCVQVQVPPPGFEGEPKRSEKEKDSEEQREAPVEDEVGAERRKEREENEARKAKKEKQRRARRDHKKNNKTYLAELEEEGFQVPGRKRCDCQATRHKLVANCLSCGRIVCSQEGEGPCLYCGVIVTRDKEVRYQALLEKVRVNSQGQGNLVVENAMKEKERLVEYDRSSAKQTAIIDDQSDFFEIDANIWLSAEEKAFLKQREEEIEEQKRDEAKKVYITFDLLGRKIVSAEEKEGDSGIDGVGGANPVQQAQQARRGAGRNGKEKSNRKGQIPCNPNVEKEMKFYKSKS